MFLKTGTLECARLGSLAVVRGFTRQPDNSKRVHLTAPALPNTTKNPREDPPRETKRGKMGAGEGQKARNFGLPTLRDPTLRAPFFGVPFFLGLGPHPRCPTLQGPTMTHTRSKNGLAKNGLPKMVLAKIGRAKTTMAKNGLVKTGLAKYVFSSQTPTPKHTQQLQTKPSNRHAHHK